MINKKKKTRLEKLGFSPGTPTKNKYKYSGGKVCLKKLFVRGGQQGSKEGITRKKEQPLYLNNIYYN